MAEDTFTVERQATIEAPADRIHPLLADLHQWQRWSPWEGLDDDLQRTYSGADAGVGAVYEWSGNRKAGTGRMEIVEDRPGERLVIDLQFLRPFKSRSTTTFTLVGDGAATSVTWTMVGPMTLFSRIMGLFTSYDRMIGPDFERGLEQLRAEATRD